MKNQQTGLRSSVEIFCETKTFLSVRRSRWFRYLAKPKVINTTLVTVGVRHDEENSAQLFCMILRSPETVLELGTRVILEFR